MKCAAILGYFNCTIQELKLVRYARHFVGYCEFQLYHTGIKTAVDDRSLRVCCPFQLYHTGIKTYDISASPPL